MSDSLKDKIIVALDTENLSSAIYLVEQLKDLIKVFKVGYQLFTSEGPKAIKRIQGQSCKVFLDAKYYDIPSTVSRAAEIATKLGVFMFNLHTLGGYEMMAQTAKAVKATAQNCKIPKPLVLGVTILTSLDGRILREELGIERPLKEQVVHLAKLAKTAGLDGVIASPKEIEDIRKNCGNDFIIVTPGIRPHWANSHDQRRVTTPAEALKAGADYIVIGRPVTEARNPREATEKLIKEIEEEAKTSKC